MKRSFLIIFAMLALILAQMPTYGQQAQVKASLDTNIVEFGSPARLTIGARVRSGQNVTPPTFRNNQIIPTLELLYEEKTDTLLYESGEVTYVFHYRITSFEDSLYQLPSFNVLVDGDTLKTAPMPIRFTSLQNVDSSFLSAIDTTAQVQIFDIKPIKQTPWTLREFWDRFGFITLFLLIFGAIVSLITYVVIRKIKNQPIIPFSRPKEPAHKQALLMLNSLKERKLCENGQYKEYYTYITEILKNYISDRWGTSVMESSSTETLNVLRGKIGGKAEAFTQMKSIIETADFVKFAKMEPAPEENLKVLDMAFNIVETTRQTEEEILKEETVVPTLRFWEALKLTFGINYFNFKGRARRSEFWWFQLYGEIVFWLFNTMIFTDPSWKGAGIVCTIITLLFITFFIPRIGCIVRRLHDIGKSGWWYFVSLVPVIGFIYILIISAQDSQRGVNKWGPSPKYPNSRNTEFLNEN